MADGDNNGNRSGEDESKLWILFFALFLVLLMISIYAFCRGTCTFWHRYCYCRRGRRCCCAIDMEAYRRERESLRRLRELRHLHRMEQFQLRQRQATAQAAAVRLSQQLQHGGTGAPAVEFHPIPLATFSQIPGPIPHSFSSSGRVLTPAELHSRSTGLSSHMAHMNMNALGFILVPANGAPPFHIDTVRRGVPANANGFHFRDHLSVEQRRVILERLLHFTTYHAQEAVVQSTEASAGKPPAVATAQPLAEDSLTQIEEGRNEDDMQNNDNLVRDDLESPADQDASATAAIVTEEEEVTSFAFPLHEEPEVVDKTCAICLDEFEEGELINDASKCPHVFHRDCLLSWLDRHTVCPCCRRTMITEHAWQSAAGADEAPGRNTGRHDTAT